MISFFDIIALFCLLILLYLVHRTTKYINIEGMIDLTPITKPIKYSKDKSCKYNMTSVYLDILKEYSIDETQHGDWVLYFPCTYNDSIDQIKKINANNPNQRIFIVTNSHEISSKSNLWKNLVKKYGRQKSLKLSPSTYILNNTDDMKLFNKEYNSQNIYILKKDIQRQEGLKITNNKEEIINAFKSNYIVVQELLQNPYMIHNRKINMRFYILIVCQNNELSAYVHNNGFMYYTKKEFKKNSLDFDNNITTGYIDRWIYDVNPLTHEDFRQYLDNHNRNLLLAENELLLQNMQISTTLFNRIYDLLKDVIQAVSHTVCQEPTLKEYVTFQLFGADIAVSNELEPQIMEINMGPNLATHDSRDSLIKHTVVRDIFKILKIIPDINNGYIKLI